MDSTAVNYDASANTDDGSCLYDILGCTDSLACNYDATATLDDNSCNYGVSYSYTVGGGSFQSEVSWTLTNSAGAVVASGGAPDTSDVCLEDGCYTLDMIDSWGDGWNGNTFNILGASYTLSTGSAGSETICIGPGCTDPLAVNYDPLATSDDGSCSYCTDNNITVDVDGGSFQTEVSWTISASDGSVVASGGAPYNATLCLPDDCYTVDMVDSWGDGWNGNSFIATDELGGIVGLGTIATGTNGSFDFSLGGVACPAYGCMDTNAVNYDATADTDDGSCDYLGCTNPTAVNYDANATIDDGSCSFGCSLDLVTVILYDSYGDGWNGNSFTVDGVDYTLDAINDDGSAASFSGICIDLSVCNTATYNATGTYQSETSWEIVDASGAIIASGGANSDDFGNCFVQVDGCTDPAACNYDSSANTDDGSCATALLVTTEVCASATEVRMTGPWWNWDPTGGPIAVDNGNGTWTFTFCPAPTADMEYLLVVDGVQEDLVNAPHPDIDGDTYGDLWGCAPITDYWSYANRQWIAGSGDVTNTYGTCGSCSDVYGCMDATASNYDSSATVMDYTVCTYCVYGCTDATQSNYDASATCDDGSCIPFSFGCMDPLAENYNSAATADDGSCLYAGCTDPAATNYDATATLDDGTCDYTTGCANAPITGLFIDGIIDDRVNANYDNMNTYDANGNQVCRVDQIRIQYRPLGTSSWSQKNIASPVGYDAVTGLCNSTQSTMKPIRNLTLGTTYEWRVKVWYCNGGNGGWTDGANFTTAPECPNAGSLAVFGANPTKATFTWDASNGDYEFLRIKIRVDSISNPTVSDFVQVGGVGVSYGTFTKDKNGLTPGETYRGQGRTWCDPNGGAYNSLTWSSFGTWTQPTLRLEGGEAIANLDVYPNPSREVFNVTFTSDDVQDLEVRVINIVGEVVYTEDLQQFVGEYTKSIDLATYTKGVYFLEISTNNGVVNKKLILQ
jgi:hypothetical protein